MLPSQGRNIVATGTFPSLQFVSTQYGAEVVHRITATGPITLKHRLPVYEATLAATPSSNYCCILDNGAGHENDLSFSDLQVLARILVDASIACYYGATITDDVAYPRIVDLASVYMSTTNIRGEILSTADPQAAERFIVEKLRLMAATTGGPIASDRR